MTTREPNSGSENGNAHANARAPGLQSGDFAGVTVDELEELESAKGALKFIEQVKADMDFLTLGKSPPAMTDAVAEPKAYSTTVEERPAIEWKARDGAVGETLGRFRILETLGQGGFARVFLAYDPTLARNVALKVPMPQCLASNEARLRFEREAKAASILSHPGIVTVFEAGSVGPITYIASEFCEGETLAAWFRRQPADVDVRIAASTVARLAQAVQHAHQRGVIHRDLKPANILVLIGDAELEERVRITDFGLAKQLSADDATLTVSGAVIGTPAYMSPEQVTCSEKVTAATDIFSLGVILYEMLTGAPPHKKPGISATIHAVEYEPVPPIRLHRKTVPLELAAICQKCLEKAPTRRYATAFDLEADLQRFLIGQPVSARHPTAVERLIKWAGRNKLIASSLALTLFTLIIGVATTWSLYRQSESSRLLTMKAKDEAVTLREQADDARQLAEARMSELHEQMDLLTNIFDQLESKQQGQFNSEILSEQLRENLLKAADRVFESNADPSLRGSLAARLGHSLGRLGFGDESLKTSQRALALGRNAKLPEAELLQLELFAAMANSDAGDFEATIENLAPLIEPVMRSDHLNAKSKVSALHVLGHAYLNANRAAEAKKPLRQLVELFEQLRSAPDNATQAFLESRRGVRLNATTVYQLAKSQYHTDPSEKHLADLLASRDLIESDLGLNDWATIGAGYSIALILGNLGRVDEALEMAEAAYENAAAELGLANWQTITAINSVIVICGTHMEQPECSEKIRDFLPIGRKACEAFSKKFGDDNPQVIGVYGNVAAAYSLVGDLESCIKIRRKLIGISERKYTRDHLLTQQNIFGLGMVLIEAGQPQEARELLTEFVTFAKTSKNLEPTNVRAANQELQELNSDSDRSDSDRSDSPQDERSEESSSELESGSEIN